MPETPTCQAVSWDLKIKKLTEMTSTEFRKGRRDFCSESLLMDILREGESKASGGEEQPASHDIPP